MSCDCELSLNCRRMQYVFHGFYALVLEGQKTVDCLVRSETLS